MISAEVHRTLVKSPPELWSELSDAEALGRHLCVFGEVRIVALEQERQIEWEADDANGKVELSPSGWGTKVRLSVTRELPAPTASPERAPAVDPEPTSAPEPAPAVEPEPMSVSEPTPAVEPELRSVPEPVLAVEHEPMSVPEPVKQAKRWGKLLRKLLRRPVSEAQQAVVAQPTVEARSVIDAQPTVVAQPTVEARSAIAKVAASDAEDTAAEPIKAEDELTIETTALLSAVLDRLGAAHHRPFSRT